MAVNQFSIKGPKHTRRPDIILFVNGLPGAAGAEEPCRPHC
ncbi:MAG: type I restriction endonuclease [Methylobacter sp.]|nr:type I restriction endonuclease [Methylobacter sp.]MDP1663680.1 type I restriction endonuclease [Methylobacter sp.]